jgi:hypothetical protein
MRFKIGNDDYILGKLPKTERINKRNGDNKFQKYKNKKIAGSFSFREKIYSDPSSPYYTQFSTAPLSLFQEPNIISPFSLKFNDDTELEPTRRIMNPLKMGGGKSERKGKEKEKRDVVRCLGREQEAHVAERRRRRGRRRSAAARTPTATTPSLTSRSSRSFNNNNNSNNSIRNRNSASFYIESGFSERNRCFFLFLFFFFFFFFLFLFYY